MKRLGSMFVGEADDRSHTREAQSMVGVSEHTLCGTFDFASLVFSLLPNGLAIVAIIFVCVERQKGANQRGTNYYDCWPH